MADAVRVRFAPSPTGHLHIGSLRVALFNMLFARHNNGVFLVRIEDTDVERSLDIYTESIMTTLAWAGITSDEPIVKQTDRFSLYRAVIERLLGEKKAYRCFCQNTQRADGEYAKYDGRCRVRRPEPGDEQKPHAIRLIIPRRDETITFNDMIRGSITFPLDQFDDFILVRSDGTPLYNFVVVVDDIDMRISHVIRGEDHIANTPKQIFLYQALGARIPEFAHAPLILGPNGQRLSKRDAATAVIEYRDKGYLPQALCNYLIRLGWAHGDQEIFTLQEMINLFTLNNVGKSGSMFDQAKLDWMNQTYIRNTSGVALKQYMETALNIHLDEICSLWSVDTIVRAIDLYKERIKTIVELVPLLRNLCHGEYVYESLVTDATISLQAVHAALNRLIDHLQQMDRFTASALADLLKLVAQESTLKFAPFAQAVRCALTGSLQGPSVADIMLILGKETVIKRLQKAVQKQ